MRSGLRKKLDDFYSVVENRYRAYARTKYIKKILKEMGGGNKNFDSYYEEYKKYWLKYGQKPGKMWLRLYSKDEEGFNPRYIPDNLWFGKIIPYYSNMMFRRPYEDKNFHDKLFFDLNRPITIGKCIAGIYFENQGNIISKEHLVDIILEGDNAIMKPSIDSGSGRLIQFFDKGIDKREDVYKKIDVLGQNFIVQKIVTQHEKIDAINPKSLNTIRVITFLFGNEVHILSSIFRMGAGNSRVDNVSAGGLQINIDSQGCLVKEAMDTDRNKYESHPNSKVKFEGYELPGYKKILDTISVQHKKLPHFKIIGWDFAVDQNEEPVFIEYNTCPDQNQMTARPTFGDLTEKVLEDVFITQQYKNAQN